MKITYTFMDGKTAEIEVSEEWGSLLLNFDKKECNSERRDHRADHKYSRGTPIALDAVDYEGDWFADDIDILGDLIRKEKCTNVHKAMGLLKPQQKELLYKVFFAERTLTSIANEEGVSEAAIRGRLKKIYVQMKKLLS